MSLAAKLFASPLRTPLWVLRFFLAALREGSAAFLRFQPGYHGSTIPSRKFIQDNRERLFNVLPGNDGIDLNRGRQRELLERFIGYYPDFTAPEQPTGGRLFHYANPMFGFPDGFILYSMFRTFKPRRVVEVGSGFSSALMLDMSRDFLPDTRFTFIDPYSQNIQDVLRGRPEGHYELIRREVQDIDLALFADLGDGDVLFIDTSHSVKIGSDVSTILFRILPALNPGVLVHIHDIYYPWEYPEDFVLEGRTYNELYFVRAFLQFNSAFEILYNSSQMEFEHPEAFTERMPGYFKVAGQTRGHTSLWLRKVA